MISIMDLLVFRHGETDWNRNHRIQGHSDIPLNDLGRSQAQDLGRKLSRFKIDAVVSSDLKRAHETAQIALRETGLAIQLTTDLREAHLGDYEGLGREALQTGLASEHWRRWISVKAEDFDFALPGGETCRAHQTRMRRFLEALVSAHSQNTVAVSTHGGSLRRLLQLASHEGGNIIANCALHRFKVWVQGSDFRWDWLGEV